MSRAWKRSFGAVCLVSILFVPPVGAQRGVGDRPAGLWEQALSWFDVLVPSPWGHAGVVEPGALAGESARAVGSDQGVPTEADAFPELDPNGQNLSTEGGEAFPELDPNG